MPGYLGPQADERKESAVRDFGKRDEQEQSHAIQGVEEHQAIVGDWVPGPACQIAGYENIQNS